MHPNGDIPCSQLKLIHVQLPLGMQRNDVPPFQPRKALAATKGTRRIVRSTNCKYKKLGETKHCSRNVPRAIFK